MRTSEQIQISIEDTMQEIQATELLLFQMKKLVNESKIDEDTKMQLTDFKKLDSQIEWLQNIKEDEQSALIFLDDKVNAELEDLKISDK